MQYLFLLLLPNSFLIVFGYMPSSSAKFIFYAFKQFTVSALVPWITDNSSSHSFWIIAVKKTIICFFINSSYAIVYNILRGMCSKNFFKC